MKRARKFSAVLFLAALATPILASAMAFDCVNANSVEGLRSFTLQVADRTVSGSGIASWYGPTGNPTASGAPFSPNGLTAAHRTLPFGTRVKVTNVSNNRSVCVTITDRGPFARGRIIDLTERAKNALGMGGTTAVKLGNCDG